MNLNLSPPVKEFVKELNGRYKKHVSDEFLEALLEVLIKDTAYWEQKCWPNKAIVLPNVVYLATFKIFESILEHQCNAGGNGHHVAQELAIKFV